jgi:hypothetical protein
VVGEVDDYVATDDSTYETGRIIFPARPLIEFN